MRGLGIGPNPQSPYEIEDINYNKNKLININKLFQI
jgi:hypothetical protein